jgi:hypothetical protein
MNILSRLVELAFSVATPVLTLFAMWLAHRLVKVFEDKTKVQVPAQWQDMIDGWVLKAVNLAESKSQQALASGAAKLSGPEKLEVAVGFVLDLAEKSGYENMARDYIINLVQAHLAANK